DRFPPSLEALYEASPELSDVVSLEAARARWGWRDPGATPRPGQVFIWQREPDPRGQIVVGTVDMETETIHVSELQSRLDGDSR
ncbi:MAG: hypothetical protein KDC38_16430, partial [Planctomycetes bacterium]|nr:hypothetical protein [Planctomycetota bacterium]